MKLIIKINLLFICFLLFAGCNNENNNINEAEIFTENSIIFKSAFENNIGYVDLETNNFIKINENELKNHWRKILETNTEATSAPNIEFNEIKLIKAELEEGVDPYYMLNTTTKDKSTSITSKIILTDSGFKMSGETCTCTSTGCNLGCEVMSMCSCSSCSLGTCEKTHTFIGRLSQSDFSKNK